MPVYPRLARTTPTPKPGIVHLGPGAFFRAFNAIYTDEAMAVEGGAWGIIAVSLRSHAARDQLAPQRGVYTSITRGAAGDTTRVISAINKVMVAPEDPRAVVLAMADAGIRITSLTITEKGYCHHPATGRLALEHPDIVHDLANPDAPRSAPGLIVAALAERRAQGAGPFTVLSCDNLPSNGAMTRQVVLDYATALDPGLAKWIASHVPFPATMVDRITPATTPEDIARLSETHGYHDPGAVVHEAFRQWVIEDNFIAGRPAWDRAGVQFVHSVETHETMKLRCLNGTHSTLAYLGYLAGCETIAETVALPAFADLCQKLWQEEILPTVTQPQGEDLRAYCTALLQRYRDTAIRHRTWQIAMDGSQKLPQRILGTILDARAAGRLPYGLCLAVAGWMRYVGGIDEKGEPIDVRDPLADQLKAASDSAPDAAGKVAALLSIEAIFPRAISTDVQLVEGLVRAYKALDDKGAHRTVSDFVNAMEI